MCPSDWAAIPGYGDRYEVSIDGRIRRKAFADMAMNWRKGKELRISTKTRYVCAFVTVDRKPYCIYVHRALAQAFIPNPDRKPHINHIDGNPRNNSLQNLEWVTAKENMRHARSARLRRQKLDDAQVRAIRDRFIPRCRGHRGNSTQLANEFCITSQQIRNIASGRHWTWLL